MRKIALGFILGLLTPLLAAYLFVRLGGMPVATAGRPLPFEHYIAHVAIHAAMGPAADRPSPLPASEANLAAGARLYQAECVVCHGAPDRPASITARGMFPPPPPLVRADQKGVTDDSVGESFWKIKNGLRLTGMPGYDRALSDSQIWQVSLLLQNAHGLPDSVRAILQAPPPPLGGRVTASSP